MAYKRLYAKGYRNLRVLDEGIPGWIQQGYPTEGWRAGGGEGRSGLWRAGGQRPSPGEIVTEQFGDRVQTVKAGQLPSFTQDAGPKAREAYRFASSEQGKVLEWIPCYCGCNRIGHRHNRDCYIKSFNSDGTVTFTSHGAT